MVKSSMRFWNFFWQVFKILKMGGFDKTIWGQSYALESGFERTRLSPDFFIKSPHFVDFQHQPKKVPKAHRLFDHENVIFGVSDQNKT